MSHDPALTGGRQGARVAATLVALMLAGCASTSADKVTGLYAQPIGDAPATTNPTQYSSALTCLASNAATSGRVAPRVAVGAIADLTGKRDITTGAKVSQGASLFAISALGKAGLRLVERADRGISDTELAYAQNHTLSDSPEKAGSDPENYRPIYAGQIAGSDFYIVGGLTELNYNIRSSGVDARGGDVGTGGLKGSLTGSTYVINIAIDMRMVDSRSQEIIDITSYQKQIIGREIKPGVFDFLNGNVIDVSGGKSELEPMQLAARTLVERSIYDFASTLLQIKPSNCLNEPADGAKPRQARPVQSVQAPPPAAQAPRPAAPVVAAPGYNGPYLDRSRWLAPDRGAAPNRP
ncbi:holdfast anchoring protein HfaB [Caulobacter sp. ErkDOM-YI]|uniref:holdfast anchoring protein HfaB n=1 Tax=unclassified Caulobacter TaxID=2648921 RepID=UPI003AF43F06